MRIHKQFKILNRIIGFSLMLKSRKFSNQTVYGFSNNTIDNKYIIFIDYDNKDFNKKTYNLFELIKYELKEIQKLFCLSDFYIFKTLNGFHVICFDKINLDTYLAILNNSSCCNKFKRTPLYFGHNKWTLRLTEKDGKKPIFIYRLKSKYNQYEKSLPHIKIIEKFHNIIIDKKNCDDETEFVACKYPV